jgi:glycerol-3-phosphate acyltransferase PlsY
MMPLLALALAYLIGGIPFGYLLVRLKTGQDVRSLGSGNIGATNVLRTSGRAIAIVTLLLDIAKGFCAVWLAAKLTNDSVTWTSLAALVVMAGHAFPVFLKFRGGKAMASFIGAFLYLTPIPLLATLVLFAIVVAATHHISMGSIIAAASLPLAAWLIMHPPQPVVLVSFIAGVFVVVRHRENIQRIRAGKEHVFRFQ